MNLLVALCLLRLAHCFGALHLDYASTGAVCRYVQSSGNARITAYLENVPKDTSIPTLIFRYVHAANFSSVPPVTTYVAQYPTRFDVDTEPPVIDGKFLLTLGPEYDHVDEQKISNTPLTPSSQAVLDIAESGVYCVYVYPPTDAKLELLQVKVRVKHSYGLLPFSTYVVYSQLLRIFFVGNALLGLLYHAIIKYRVGKDFSNLNNVSLISKWVILYILLPGLALVFGTWLLHLLANHFSPLDNPLLVLTSLALALAVANLVYGNFLNFAYYLFTLGYGVIYADEGSARLYRTIPAQLMTKAKWWFYIAVTLMLAVQLSFLYYDPSLILNQGLDLELLVHPKTMPTGVLVISSITSLFNLAWFVVTIRSYFATKKAIATFTPVTGADDADELNQKITTAFRRLILVIFLVPFVLVTLYITSMCAQAGTGLSNVDVAPGANRIFQSYVEAQTVEFINSKPLAVKTIPWVSFGSVYAVVLGVYLIWVKDNNGLLERSVVEGEEET